MKHYIEPDTDIDIDIRTATILKTLTPTAARNVAWQRDAGRRLIVGAGR